VVRGVVTDVIVSLAIGQPGAKRRIGSVRSRACTWDFSSTDSTAPAGRSSTVGVDTPTADRSARPASPPRLTPSRMLVLQVAGHLPGEAGERGRQRTPPLVGRWRCRRGAPATDALLVVAV
jgi:hypothetical protein